MLFTLHLIMELSTIADEIDPTVDQILSEAKSVLNRSGLQDQTIQNRESFKTHQAKLSAYHQ